MNKDERLQAHWFDVPEYYLPQPELHLNNPRDGTHFNYSINALSNCHSVLDVGCWDGWLDFLLINAGYQVEGVELIPSLAEAARRYAKLHALQYTIFTGFFEDLQLNKQYDAILCYETLEHVWPIENYITALERASNHKVIISLPNQRHEDNQPQHLWTPTLEKIHHYFGTKKHIDISYKDYPGTNIPGNWFINYEVSR